MISYLQQVISFVYSLSIRRVLVLEHPPMSDIPSNELLQHLGVEYQFRVTVIEASQIPIEYEDIFCQFNFLHQHQEAYSTEPIKNSGKMDIPLNFSHIQNVNH